MIFAELEYPEHYSDIHDELVAYLRAHFPVVQAGHQGDSWIWLTDAAEKVEVDTFSSIKHQIKSASAGQLLRKVVTILKSKYMLRIYEPPKLEGPED